jgi:hypothetical protein
MYQALLADPQEALHKRHLVYCMRVMSVACTRFGVELMPHFSEILLSCYCQSEFMVCIVFQEGQG